MDIKEAREQIENFAKQLEASLSPKEGDDKMRANLETDDGWAALEAAIRNQPDLRVAKADVKFIMRRLYRDDKVKLDQVSARLDKIE